MRAATEEADQDTVRNVAMLGAQRHGKTCVLASIRGANDPDKDVCAGGYYLQFTQRDKTGVVHLGTELHSFSLGVELRMYDGAAVLVDCTQGVCGETKTIVVKAALERTEVVFCVTKLDALLLSSLSLRESLNVLVDIVTEINTVAAACSSGLQRRYTPAAGNVILCSAMLEFAIGVEEVAGMFSEEYLDKLWGNGEIDRNAFCSAVLLPLQQALTAPVPFSHNSLLFLQPFSRAFTRLILDHLPSPLACARFRSEINIGESTPAMLQTAIADSDPAGPLLAYIGKKIYFKRKLFAMARVFSGTLNKGAEVFSTRISDIRSVIAYNIETLRWSLSMSDENCLKISAGNIGLIEDGKSKLIVGTVVTDLRESLDFRCSSDPFIMTARVRIAPAIPSDLPQITDCFRRIRSLLPSVCFTVEDFNELWATDFPTLHTAVEFLRKDLEVQIHVSEPTPLYRETILSNSSQTCLAKSPNRHNRLYCTAEPLPELIASAMESQPGVRDSNTGWKKRVLTMWNEAGSGNEVVNNTKGCAHFSEVEESLSIGFQYFCKCGVLCEESVRGIRIIVEDVLMCADSIHRSPGQIIPTMRRCCMACQLTSTPALLEPVYTAEIIAPVRCYTDITATLTAKRAGMLRYEALPCGNMGKIVAELSWSDSAGLSESVEMVSGGLAFTNLSLGRWQLVPGDPLDPRSESGQLVQKLRSSKGLRPTVTELSAVLDRL